ncbi:GNAT family N-acetyltransferase [Streptomyces sp. NPDC014734]|uniref:GNAT family N-acetyltransferase n=1 Tax=Streptomyces sp. NPDC014734 TaxID=3364886 RepID=UPI0036FA4FB7
MSTPTLRTERLLLEPYSPADENFFVRLFQDIRVSRWIGDGPHTEAEDRALFERVFSKVYAGDLFDVWVVRHGGRPIGHAEIKPSPSPDVDGHEIVYALDPDAWGNGFGTEIARTLTSYGYDVLGLSEVYATVSVENAASLALLDRIGFRHVRDTVEDDGSTTHVLVRPGPSTPLRSDGDTGAAGQPR